MLLSLLCYPGHPQILAALFCSSSRGVGIEHRHLQRCQDLPQPGGHTLHLRAGGQGAASLGSACPQPLAQLCRDPQPETGTPRQGLWHPPKTILGLFSGRSGALRSPAGCWQLLPCGVRECPLANWEATHYVMRTEAGQLRELRSAPHATQICSSSPGISPVHGTPIRPLPTAAGAWCSPAWSNAWGEPQKAQGVRGTAGPHWGCETQTD